jgi:hypothetical protein
LVATVLLDVSVFNISKSNIAIVLLLTDLGGYHGQFTPEMYQYWVDNWSLEKHQQILLGLRKFIDSGEYLYNPS